MPGTVPLSWEILTHLIFALGSWDKYYFCPPFPAFKVLALRSWEDKAAIYWEREDLCEEQVQVDMLRLRRLKQLCEDAKRVLVMQDWS